MKIANCILIVTFSAHLDFVELSSQGDSSGGHRPPVLPFRKRNLHSLSEPSELAEQSAMVYSSQGDSSRGSRHDKLPIRKRNQPSSSESNQPISQYHLDRKLIPNREPPLMVVRMTAAQLRGIRILRPPLGHYGPLDYYPVIDYLDVVIDDDTIIGMEKEHELAPVYNAHNEDAITLKVGPPVRFAEKVDDERKTYPGSVMFWALPENTIYVHPAQAPTHIRF